MEYKVIDLSKFNNVTNFKQVASDVDGVILRAGYRAFKTGQLVVDPKFKQYIEGFTSVGAKVGIYFFTTAINVAEANSYSPTTESERNIKLYTENDVFYHTPKIKSYIKPERVDIENPPDKSTNEKVPIIISIGSSAIIGISSCFTIFNALRDLRSPNADKSNLYEQEVTTLFLSCFDDFSHCRIIANDYGVG